VYFYDVWVGDDLPTDYQAILGMDFMVPAGIRLDLGDGSISLPDEVSVMLHGRRQIFSGKARPVYVGEHRTVKIAQSLELPLRLRESDNEKLWLARGERWVPTLVKGPGKLRYLRVTNLSDTKLILNRGEQIGLWLAEDRVPRQPGFVSVGSRRYAEWQTLMWEATTDAALTATAAPPASDPVLAVDRAEYATPRRILSRPKSPEAASRDKDPPLERPATGSRTLNDGQRQHDETPGIRLGRNQALSHLPATTDTHTDLTVGRDSAAASGGEEGPPATRGGAFDAPERGDHGTVRHIQVQGLGPEIDPPPDTAVTTRVSAISVKNVMQSDDQSPDSVQGQGLELTFPKTSNGHNARQDGCAEGAWPREVPRESCAPGPGAKAAHEDDKAQGVNREADGGSGAEIWLPVGVHELKALPKVDHETETSGDAPLLPAEDPPVASEVLVSDPAEGEGDVTVARMAVDVEQDAVVVSHDRPIGSVADPVVTPVAGSDRDPLVERGPSQEDPDAERGVVADAEDSPNGSVAVPLAVDDADHLDFDEALFTEDSWDRVVEEGEYKVEKISDVRTGRRSRYGRTLRESKVHWRGYGGPKKRISTAARCCASSCKIGRSGSVFR
jgi:hypothetical protein